MRPIQNSNPEQDPASGPTWPTTTARSRLIADDADSRPVDDPYWLGPSSDPDSSFDAAMGVEDDVRARRTRHGVLAAAGFAVTILAVVAVTPESDRLETTATLAPTSTGSTSSTADDGEVASDRLRSQPAPTPSAADGARSGAGGNDTTFEETPTSDSSTSQRSTTTRRAVTSATPTSAPTTTRPTTARPTTTAPTTTAQSSTSSTAPSSTTTETTAESSTTSSTSTSSTSPTSSSSSTTSSSTTSSSTTSSTTTPTSTTTSTSTTSTSTSTSTSASTPPQCVLGPVAVDDTFRGSAVDSGTWAVSDGTTGSGLQLRPSAVSVRNDALEITTSMDGDEKVSGGVVLRDAQTYGRYEIRAHMTTAASVTGTLNVRASGSGFGSGGALSFSVAGMQWRTFVIDWTPGEIKLLRDGVVISTVTETGADEVPDDARALALEVDPASHELSAPASMEIGSVKVRTYQGC